MGSGASTKKYKSDVESFAPAFSEEPEIESNRNSTTDNINQKAELSISTDSMKVNNSRDEIKEAVNRARNESAIGRAAHDVPAPTPPESPAPTSRNRRSGSNPTERGVPLDRGSPQADFIIDEDSGQFDDESPAMNISDINEFLSLQRQQTVSVMKNAQLEREVAELEKQLRQMDMMDAGSSVPDRLPSVDKPSVAAVRAILSRERPGSGAAVMPDPTATTAHRDDSYTPTGTSSRQSSRGLIKSALRNANSASALEAASVEQVRKYNSPSLVPRQELSPPPSPPPPDPEGEGTCKTRVIEYSDSDTNDGPQQALLSHRKIDKGEIRSREDSAVDAKAEADKQVMRFEQPPHNAHHRRHIGHRRNSSENSIKATAAAEIEEEQAASDSIAVTSSGQNSLSLLSRKHKDKVSEKEKVTVVITRRRRGTSEEKTQAADHKPLLPPAEVKRLLVPVNATSTASTGTTAGLHKRTRASNSSYHPKSAASLSPLIVNAADEAALTENDEDSPRRINEKASPQVLAPLPLVPTLKNSVDETTGGRIPLLPVSLIKEKGRNNSVLQSVNKRRTRSGTEDEHNSSAAAIAYLQAISPREDSEKDGQTNVPPHMSESVMLSGSLSSRINNQANGTVSTSLDMHAVTNNVAMEAIPPIGEQSSLKAGAAAHPVRRRQNKHPGPTSPEANKVEAMASWAKKERDSDMGTDSDVQADKSDWKKRVVVTKRTKRKSFGGSVPDQGGEESKDDRSSKINGTDFSAKGSVTFSGSTNDVQSRPWSQTMELRLGEVEFMLRKPIESDNDINQILADAKDGLAFMDELNSVAKSLNMLRGSLSRWLLPYDNNTRIDEQCSSFRTVVDNMPDYLVGKLTQKQVTYLVSEVNKVRQLVRVKIADDNDLEQARTALESTAIFFQRLVEESAACNISPYALFSSKRI